MTAFDNLLEAVDNSFYFGIGGIGDYLLLISTFYEKLLDDSQIDVVFVANDIKTMSEFTKNFPKIRKHWFSPIKSFNFTSNTWSKIKKKDCLGTGVTPYNFEYIKDWNECGNKGGPFKYYGIKKFDRLFKPFRTMNDKTIVTFQPFGGHDQYRISVMSQTFIETIILKHKSILGDNVEFYLIGSNEDSKKLGNIDYAKWIINFEDSLDILSRSNKHYSVNSWTKSFTGLIDTPTYIIPSLYKYNPRDIYMSDIDPSDHVFLRNWGFKFLERGL